ncbi:uncharacterized protein [Rutidosis leptorrhynchoides]|uniref:uncharacterized protein n=1 Tax=Rutidosis leptorrhynchoides TaxID=125765 RepID=UPI003A9977B2
MKSISLNIRSFKIGGVEDKFGWVRKLIVSEKPTFLALQETKLHTVDFRWVFSLWGSNNCEFIQRAMVGKSGGQLLIWDTDEFEAESTIAIDFVIGIKGVWKKSGSKVNILNIHGPHDDHNKQTLWASLVSLLCSNKDEAWLICGDFNEVRCPSERLNCDFISNRARWFNDFIEQCHLVEIPLSGRIFTRVSEDGIKFSKLDRFLVCEKFMDIWQNLSATALERKHSDHCPIMLKDDEKNFGPKPFKLFDAWLDEDGVDQIIKDAWDIKPSGNRLDCVFRNKLKNVKEALKSWSKTKFSSLDNEIEALKIAAQEMETKAELG